MNTEAILQIKRRSRKILTFVNLLIWGACILTLIGIGLLVWASFLPKESFTAEQGIALWSLSVDQNSGGGFFLTVPFRILQPLSPNMFEAKTAFIVYLSSWMITFVSVLLYGMKQVRTILGSIVNSHTPFMRENANSFKKLAVAVIGYSLLGDLILNLAMVLFVTGIFNITLSNISISGLVIGLLLLIVSQIFSYGAYLQEEVDTTL